MVLPLTMALIVLPVPLIPLPRPVDALAVPTLSYSHPNKNMVRIVVALGEGDFEKVFVKKTEKTYIFDDLTLFWSRLGRFCLVFFLPFLPHLFTTLILVFLLLLLPLLLFPLPLLPLCLLLLLLILLLLLFLLFILLLILLFYSISLLLQLQPLRTRLSGFLKRRTPSLKISIGARVTYKKSKEEEE